MKAVSREQLCWCWGWGGHLGLEGTLEGGNTVTPAGTALPGACLFLAILLRGHTEVQVFWPPRPFLMGIAANSCRFCGLLLKRAVGNCLGLL